MFQKLRQEKGIIVRFPSKQTTNIIFDETASYACSLIFKMMFRNVGIIEDWRKKPREALHEKNFVSDWIRQYWEKSF